MSLQPVAPSLPTEETLAPAIVDSSPEEHEYQLARLEFLLPERAGNGGLLLLGTLVLFALSMWGESSWLDVVLLILVLFFHELGHWAGMRLFGFQDVRMFFIPFFGAAVSGRNVGAEGWKEALVLLLGPLPGIFLGCVLAGVSLVSPSPELGRATLLLLILNGFNLLPMVPLDGGRLFQVILFSRHRYLESAFTLVTSLALVGVSIALEAWLLGFIGLFNLVGIVFQARLLKQAQELRTAHPGLVQDPTQLDDTSMRALYDTSRGLLRTSGEQQTGTFKGRAQMMRRLHERMRQRPPSALASLGLSGLWLAGLVALLVGVVLAVSAPAFRAGAPAPEQASASQPEAP